MLLYYCCFFAAWRMLVSVLSLSFGFVLLLHMDIYSFIFGNYCAFAFSLYPVIVYVLFRFNIIYWVVKLEFQWVSLLDRIVLRFHFLLSIDILQNGKLLRSIRLHNVAVTCLNWEEESQLKKVYFVIVFSLSILMCGRKHS